MTHSASSKEEVKAAKDTEAKGKLVNEEVNSFLTQVNAQNESSAQSA